jgi:hypothetical protein
MEDVEGNIKNLEGKLKPYFDFRGYSQARNVPLSQDNLVECVVFDLKVPEKALPNHPRKYANRAEIMLLDEEVIVYSESGTRYVTPLQITSEMDVISVARGCQDEMSQNRFIGEILRAYFPVIPCGSHELRKAEGQMSFFDGDVGLEAYLTDVLKHVCKDDKFSFSREDIRYGFNFYSPDVWI